LLNLSLYLHLYLIVKVKFLSLNTFRNLILSLNVGTNAIPIFFCSTLLKKIT
jgi:hypothetical protein